MLTKVTAYSQWANVDPLVLNVINRSETDLFEVRNIDGLGAVKADVNTSDLGSIDGESFIGTSVGKRNIVITLGLDPDWQDWTISRLRRLLSKYFMPKQSVRLEFETMEFSPVEISGYIESNEPNMFSKDPEQQISIICPELYFKSVDYVSLSGNTDMDPIDIDYEGNVETGLVVTAHNTSGDEPMTMGVRVMDPYATAIEVTTEDFSPVLGPKRFGVSSVPGDKYVRTVIPMDGSFTSLLNDATITGRWPVIGPGTNTFEVYSDSGVQDWTLIYYNLFGEL